MTLSKRTLRLLDRLGEARRLRRRTEPALKQALSDFHFERKAHEALRTVLVQAGDGYFRSAMRDVMEDAAHEFKDKLARDIAEKLAKLPKVTRVSGPMGQTNALVFTIEMMQTVIHARTLR